MVDLEFYRGSRILVTGGTGSIGSQIVRQLLSVDPEVVRILSRDETRQLELEEKLERRHDLRRVRFLIGDVRDAARLRRAMEGMDIVFHAAAMKHVPACEYNPFEAVQTNVLGTQNIITSAREAGVRRVVLISTDKATSPENTMGATKLLSERLLVAAHQFSSGLTLAAVRFGNVIGSRGSLAPRVQRQLREEGCAQLTHPEMTRFMMTVQDAVALVLEAGRRAQGGEIFILRMPSLRVRDLIEVLIREEAQRAGASPADFPLRIVGMRPGEKLHESLVTAEESRRTRQEPGSLLVIDPPSRAVGALEEERPDMALESSRGPFLSQERIRELLVRGGVLPPTPLFDSAPAATAPRDEDGGDWMPLARRHQRILDEAMEPASPAPAAGF